jgi:unsaturated chondroitin disaccharide hydrolase
LLPLATYTGTHDLGFMIGLPLGLAMRLDPSKSNRARYRSVYRSAARSLAQRWNPQVGAFQSDTYEGEWGLIIDSAMNAPFLINAGLSIGGHEGARLAALGTQHMKTLARYFVRADGSTIHRLKFDRSTGALIGSTPGQGLSGSSTWSRGQAWAIYGFAQAYGLTRDPEFLSIATRTADYWLRQLPDGCIPAWDFSATDGGAPRDSSASAIAAAGMLHLARVAPNLSSALDYRRSALAALGVLSRRGWTKPKWKNPGILQRQSHAVPIIAREGSYTWGDAYFLQALYSRGT